MAIEDSSVGTEAENTPANIKIYAREVDGGEGKETQYVWEGKLHQSEGERKVGKTRDDVMKDSYVSSSLDSLAKNFASQYQERQDPELKARGESSYGLKFIQEEELEGLDVPNTGNNTSLRGLTEQEREEFINAFQEANREASKTDT